SILGSTGSIGKQTLEIVRENKDKFRIGALGANTDIDRLEAQVREFRPRIVAIGDVSKYKELKSRIGTLAQVTAGTEGVVEAAAAEECDTVISAIVGIAGLVPTYNAIRAGKNIALANKETLVTAGRIITGEVRKKKVSMLPVDSEHSAIFQSMNGSRRSEVAKLILTASGGPFRNKTWEELQNVKVQDALKHPNWSMGRKITVDSATLMNKGLEVIEARWLFDILPEKIEVCVHPESIIHSAVEFVDGAVIAQLGLPDMKLPIQYALTYPERLPMNGKRLSLTDIGNLDFYKPDTEKFKCLGLALKALEMGDSACVVLNGANEEAVRLFLEEKISFLEIGDLIEKTLDKHKAIDKMNIDDVMALDRWSRETLFNLYEVGCC
ncbi:MAG TPA: 1-deoxy-D-xylulose-5-phosphate reductoisomerase, partial [Negativicutes bacterium]|nr:1-deoxy-D-xylulose-5-phosphate reductoisomerase [Negativicutes bacterium]